MKRPNFFIVGAPKCGTTSMYRYLKSHPNVYLSKRKEPHYFARDLSTEGRGFVMDVDNYLGLFRRAGKKHQVVGEASALYLFSGKAIRNIYEFNPSARLLALVRNPIDMVHSFHSQTLYNLNEDEKDFETAWRLQEERRQGRSIPPASFAPESLQYAGIAMLGAQVKDMLEVFPEEQVKILFFDKLASSPLEVYMDVLEFLGLSYDGRTRFPILNRNRIHRSEFLAGLIKRPPAFLQWIRVSIKKLLGVANTGILVPLVKANTKTIKRPPIPDGLRREMVDVFREDVHLLSKITNRNLDHWLEK